MIDKSKIAILTTTANFELYYKTSKLFPKGIQKYVIDGTNGMYGIESIYYMMKKIKGKGIEWLIMADEDVVFSDCNAVFSIINDMSKNDITVCGVRDGGVIDHRKENPWMINTFFSILNFKTIESIWNKKRVIQNQYVLKDEFNDDLSKLKINFDVKSLYEPYYRFYFWLRRQNKKFLFLDAVMHRDDISNKVLFNNKEFLCHTWYARDYGNNEKHTSRINRILDENHASTNGSNNERDGLIIFKNNYFSFRQKIKKNIKRVYKKVIK